MFSLFTAVLFVSLRMALKFGTMQDKVINVCIRHLQRAQLNSSSAKALYIITPSQHAPLPSSSPPDVGRSPCVVDFVTSDHALQISYQIVNAVSVSW